jgi:hypothetical protein
VKHGEQAATVAAEPDPQAGRAGQDRTYQVADPAIVAGKGVRRFNPGLVGPVPVPVVPGGPLDKEVLPWAGRERPEQVALAPAWVAEARLARAGPPEAPAAALEAVPGCVPALELDHSEGRGWARVSEVALKRRTGLLLEEPVLTGAPLVRVSRREEEAVLVVDLAVLEGAGVRADAVLAAVVRAVRSSKHKRRPPTRHLTPPCPRVK